MKTKYYVAVLLTAFSFRSFAAEMPLAPESIYEPTEAVEAMDFDEMVADDHGGRAHHRRRAHEVCKQVKLEDAQKAQLKEALYQYKKDRIQQRAALKLAALEYGKVLGSATTEKTAAATAAQALQGGVAKLVETSTSFLNNVFFNILKPEQREAGLAGLKAKQRRHGRHHGRHHGLRLPRIGGDQE